MSHRVDAEEAPHHIPHARPLVRSRAGGCRDHGSKHHPLLLRRRLHRRRLILAVVDKAMVNSLMGREIDGVPDVDTQLQLVHDRVMPAFA